VDGAVAKIKLYKKHLKHGGTEKRSKILSLKPIDSIFESPEWLYGSQTSSIKFLRVLCVLRVIELPFGDNKLSFGC